MSVRVGWGGAAATAASLLLPAHLDAQIRAPDLAPTRLDPDAPLAPMPDIGVEWPTLDPEPDAAEGEPAADVGAETRYTFRIDGLERTGSELLKQRFAEASTLDANDGEPANAAQLNRRAREDAELLATLLRGEGYYDARVETRIEPGPRPMVVLEATAGALYRFAGVTLEGVEAAGAKADELRRAFGVAAGSPVDADRIVAGGQALRDSLGRGGFPFAQVGEPEVVVDRAARTATLDVSVRPGGAARFGQVVALPGNRVFGPRHVQTIARFRPGDPFDQAEVDDLRRALVQTGLVSSVRLETEVGATPDTVDVGVKLDPAPPRTIAGELGYGTGEGARAELSWTHRNLFPPEGALTLRGVLGTQEQVAGLVFRRNNFRGRDRVLTAQINAAHLNRDAFDARTFSLSAQLERQTNIFFQKTWTWSLGAELLASDERDVVRATGESRRRTFLIGALPTSLNYDGSDDLLNPAQGFRLGGRLSPELSLQGAAFGYARVQLDASAYRTVRPGVVLAARTRLGTILGAPRDKIAPSRRFYAGGGASVRGYGFQQIGPRDVDNDPIGGRSLAELAVEARVRLFGNFGLVPFLDAGNIYTGVAPTFRGLRFGMGLGVRYYSSFGPIRVDVGTPLNPRSGDSRVAVYVSLGQAF